MDNKKAGAKKPKIVKKPFLHGTPTDNNTIKDALKFAGSTLIMMLAYLLLSSMMMWDSLVLRILTNGLVMISAWVLFYASGMSKGAIGVNNGEIMQQRQEQGKTLDDGDLRACYHPLKGWVTALIGTIPFFLCALVLSVIAQQQLYGLSTLPSWLESYARRTEIGGALAFYSIPQTLGLEGVLRLVVRTMIMPLVSIVGTESSANLLTLEHFSPLFTLLPALFYGFGYTRGIQVRTQVHSSIAAANRKYRRKQKKKQQQRRVVRGPEQLN